MARPLRLDIEDVWYRAKSQADRNLVSGLLGYSQAIGQH